jgi:hypothetical protein
MFCFMVIWEYVTIFIWSELMYFLTVCLIYGIQNKKLQIIYYWEK